VVPFETSVTDDGGGEFPKHLKAIPSWYSWRPKSSFMLH
jgi:hypothetical protein